jgi:hypothetical protein
MKKFSQIKKIKRFNEADEANDLKNLSIEELRKLAEKEGLIKNDENESGEDENSLTKQLVEEPAENEDNTSGNPAKFFSKLFESREMAHIYHLQVNGEMGSHAKHTALGDYYDVVLGLIDEMIEVYQGQYDIIEGYDVIDTKDTMSKDTIEYFKELATSIKAERKCFNNEDTHIHNIVDEVVALVYKTLYKLRFNK